MLCPNCGREIANEAAICAGCGRPVVIARTDAPPTRIYGPEPKSGKNGIGLVLLIIGGLSVGLGMLTILSFVLYQAANHYSWAESGRGMVIATLACPLPLIIIGVCLALIGVLLRANKPKAESQPAM